MWCFSFPSPHSAHVSTYQHTNNKAYHTWLKARMSSGMGYTKELPIERWYRLVRLYRIFEGTDEIQRFIIARNLIKGHVKVGEAF